MNRVSTQQSSLNFPEFLALEFPDFPCVSTKRVDESKRVVNACKRVETSGKRVVNE